MTYWTLIIRRRHPTSTLWVDECLQHPITLCVVAAHCLEHAFLKCFESSHSGRNACLNKHRFSVAFVRAAFQCFFCPGSHGDHHTSKLVLATGVEPVASSLEGKCSIRLSYASKIGGTGQSRTDISTLKRRGLYH